MLMGGVETNRDDQNRPAWSVISKKLKAAGFDRSAQQARCRYMRMERGRVKREQGKAKNYCKTCGLESYRAFRANCCYCKENGYGLGHCLDDAGVFADRAALSAAVDEWAVDASSA